MKDIFDVEMVVINNSQFEKMTEVSAVLQMQDGLSLAAMESGSNEQVKRLADVKPGESVSAHWYVRGDKIGSYSVSADITGKMYDEGSNIDPSPFKYHLACPNQLYVISGNALYLEIEVNQFTATGDSYPVKYTYTNVSEKSIYNLQFTFDREAQYWPTGSSENSAWAGKVVTVSELKPKESFTVTYTADIKFKDGNNNAAEFVFAGLAMQMLGGSTTSIPYSFTINSNLMGRKNLYGQSNRISVFDADPVNLLSGEFNYSYTDFTIQGGHDLVYTRYYNSGDYKINKGLGYGFRDNYMYEADYEEEYIEISFPDGTKTRFYKDDEDEYLDALGSNIEFSFDGEKCSFVKDKNTYQFNSEGNLTGITYENGWKESIAYEDGKISKVTSKAGTIEYNWTGDTISSVLCNGAKTSFKYDNNQLIKVTNADNDSMEYKYQELDEQYSFLSEMIDFEGNRYIKNSYDSTGRVTEQHVEGEGDYKFTYDDKEKTNTCEGEKGYIHTIQYNEEYEIITDVEDYETKFGYNALHQLISRKDPDGTIYYAYDLYGNVTEILYPDGTTKKYTYNAKHQVKTYKDRNDKTTTYEYNTEGLLLKEKYPNGSSISYKYKDGNIISETTGEGKVTYFSYDKAGNCVLTSDEEENNVKQTYDKYGRVIEIVDADKNITKYKYTTAGKKISETDGNGNTINYEVDGNGNVISQTDKKGNKQNYTYTTQNKAQTVVTAMGITTTYSYDQRGNVVGEEKSGNRNKYYSYDAYGKMLSSTDEAGNVWKYEYDDKGNLSKIVNPYNDTKEYTYDKNGWVKQEKDENGNITSYEYDKEGNVTAKIDGSGAVTEYIYDDYGNLGGVVDQNGNVTSYYYNKDNELEIIKNVDGETKFEYDKNGNVSSRKSPKGIQIKYEYYPSGLLKSVIMPDYRKTSYTYDGIGNVLTVENSYGDITTYTYDENGNKEQVIDEEGFRETYQYDADNRLTDVTDKNGYTTHYEYDAAGNIETITDGENNVIHNVYNKRGLIKTETDGLGDTAYEYDKLGRLIKETSSTGSEKTYTYEKNGNLSSITDGNGKTTTYEYYKNNLVKKVTDAEGGVVEYQYDGNGNVVEKKDANGNITTYSYDSNNNKRSETNALGNIEYWNYDSDGNLTEYINQKGVKTTYSYDSNSNLTSITDGENNTTVMEYDLLNRMTKKVTPAGVEIKYEYNKRGDLIKETDGNGNETLYTYDNNGNCTKVIKNNAETIYTYDGLNRVSSVCDPLGNTESYEYDAHGNVEKYTDKKGNVTTYSYDADDNLVKVIDAAGIVTEYEYDAVGNLIKSIIDSEEKSGKKEVTNYKYDGNGNLKSVTDPIGNITKYEYDKNGNLVKDKKNTYTYDAADNCITVTDKNNSVTTYEYNQNNKLISATNNAGTTSYELDALDRIRQINTANLKTISYTYDADGNRESITYSDGYKVNYEYDGNGNIEKVYDGTNTTSYQYDGNNNKIEKTTNSITERYIYDICGRLLKTMQKTGEEDILIDTYTYDAARNIESHTETGNVSGKPSQQSYTYDALNRLKTETTDNVTTAYGYDAAGNITAKTVNGETTTYEYNRANQLTGSSEAGQARMTYDSSGNLTYIGDTSGKCRYTMEYNGNDLIKSMVRNIDTNGDKTEERVSVNYSYDGYGNLTGREEKINGVQESSTTYIPDYASNNPEVLEEIQSEIFGVKYVYGADNERIYAVVNSGDATETYTLNTDVRGSTRWASDKEGTVVAGTTYDSYGNVTGNEKLSLGKESYDITTNYTHHTYDDMMETYNAGARTYIPDQARFLQKDPVAGVVTEPLTLNNYVYCLDNPVNYTDPDGCFAVSNISTGIASTAKSAGNAIDNYAASAGSKLGKIASAARENAAGTFASVVCEAVREVKWTMDKAMEVADYIDKMPYAAKAAIGTGGFVVAVAAGAVSIPTAAFIGITSLAGGGIAGAVGYTVNSVYTHEWNNKDFVHSVVNGALTDYMFAGVAAGVYGIVDAVKSGKVTRFIGDETGSVGGKGGSSLAKKYYQVTSKENARILKNSDNPQLKGTEFKEVYAWTEQPTLKQAQNSGARYLDTVIEFETNATFSKDTSIVDSSLWNIARVSDRHGPISISNVVEVGFKDSKGWWKFWKK